MEFKSISNFLLLTCFITADCAEYLISSKCHHPTEDSCLTLSQLAENATYYLDLETTFILGQGRHILNSELLIKNVSKVFVSGSGLNNVTIYCEGSGRFSFGFVNDVHITGLHYFSCGTLQVKLVDHFTIIDTVFYDHRGTVINATNSSVNIKNCSFGSNSNVCLHARLQDNVGAAMIATASDIIIEESSFEENCAKFGGVIYAELQSNITITDSVFACNEADKGGVIFAQNSHVSVNASTFRNNSATCTGAVFYLDMRSTIIANDVIMESNKANQGIVYLVESDCVFMGNTSVSNNTGSFWFYYSNVTLRGNVIFSMNTVNKTSTHYDEGGAVTVVRSHLFLEGRNILLYNKAEYGGAIHAIASEVNMYGWTAVLNNNATEFGGGIYLFLSALTCDSECTLKISGNTAKKGGGIYAVTSLLTAVYGSEVNFVENAANEDGGGIYLEVSAKINILIIHKNTILIQGEDNSTLVFTKNTAGNNGGAIYIADTTYFGTCNATRLHSTASECFLQAITLDSGVESDKVKCGDPTTHSLKFQNNNAYGKGSNIFGGLLDRCTLTPFTRHRESRQFGVQSDAIEYIKYISNYSTDLDSINSDAVRVCFCNNSLPDCSYQLPPFRVKKGESFTVSLATVDQTKHPVSSEVYSFLSSEPSPYGKVEINNTTTGDHCTNMVFSVVSKKNREKLMVYANGPCKDATFSQATMHIHFSNCTCPIGFQQNVMEVKSCVCECDTKLTRYVDIRECNNQTLVTQTNSWISYINNSDSGFIGYLIHCHCPLNYCTTSTPRPINLSLPNGSDTQCARHRSGTLCGTCETNFSISLGSSNCIACSSYWPVTFIGVSILFFLAGIALVALLLVLNITVAVGTLNGIVFYVNIIDANSSTFLHFSRPNFVTVFISWLNLDFGFDVCFIKGLDAYHKTWLQLAFPTYVIVLVAIVIMVSQHSKRFSQLIGKKNPVATLATLIFLSYAKFLKITITGLSCTTLTYSRLEGKQYIPPYAWLSEATITCYRGRHIFLFIIAVLILGAGIIYTILLFSWQWLLSVHNKLCSGRTWVWSIKLSLFIECSHAPYNPQNRYWTGLLLLVRIIVYFASTVNVTKDPSIDLFVIGVVTIAIVLLREIVSVRSRVYKKWPLEVLEVSCILNLMLFSFATLYALHSNKARTSISYVSVSITICLFLGVIFYHLFTEFISKTKVYMTMNELLTSLKRNRNAIEEDRPMEHTCTTSVLTRSEDGDYDVHYYNLDSESTY